MHPALLTLETLIEKGAVTLPSNLCSPCRLIFSCLFTEPRSHYTQHSRSVSDLKRSAETCPACLVIWTWLTPAQRTGLLEAEAAEEDEEEEEEEEEEDGEESAVVVHDFNPDSCSDSGDLGLEKGVFWEEISVQMLSFGFHCPVVDRSGMVPFSWEIGFRMYPELKPARLHDWTSMEVSRVYDSTSGESTMTQIRSWLQTCLESYTSCQNVRTTAWLPTRLIEVCENENDIEICLRLGSELQPETRYLALSHCWGRREAIKLTSKNYNDFMAGMPLDRLPKTLRDAVDITKRLGYAFLWIDSLCIIQDERADWDRECALMERVYKNCVLDIAASHSGDNFGGCYSTRNPLILDDVLIEIDNSKVTTRLDELSNWKTTEKEVFRLVGRHHEGQDLWHGPLSTRAWVLQEIFLASRVVYFGENMVSWECHSTLASEAEPDGVYETNMGRRNNVEKADRLFTPDISTCSLWNQWSSLIAAYTARKRTMYEDKLVAFAGIAKSFPAAFVAAGCDATPEYLAGLWSQDLELQLTWTRDPSDSRELEPEHGDYIAPSWSWASLDCPILLSPMEDWDEDARDRVLIKVQGYSVTPLGLDPFLQVASGSLHLEGWLWNLSSAQSIRAMDFTHDRQIRVLNIAPEEAEAYLDMYLLSVKFLPHGDESSFDCLCLQPTGVRAGQFRRIGQAQLKKPWEHRKRTDVLRDGLVNVESDSDEESVDAWERPIRGPDRQRDQDLLREILQFHWETKAVVQPIDAEDENIVEIESDLKEENGLIRHKYTIEIVR